jgi:hypothetical protein
MVPVVLTRTIYCIPFIDFSPVITPGLEPDRTLIKCPVGILSEGARLRVVRFGLSGCEQT